MIMEKLEYEKDPFMEAMKVSVFTIIVTGYDIVLS